ncbi:MAG: GTPase ObgE [Alphaproteobacteria bacterium]|nr:GTPase ObgE [Alphaproteobacteria bacterium]MBN2779529.1 GTPase ObgE [Alphaproteobacteria bacterium]
MKFLDKAKIYVKSGDGGAGCIAFHREWSVPFGGPSGGDGGRGGSVIFKAYPNLNTLIDFRFQQHFKAETGHHGEGRQRTGAKGQDLILKVPTGTVILAEDGETELADLSVDGEEFMAAKGGDGGFGNIHFKSAVNQAPRRATPGWPGEERTLILRLKLIADIGLIGLPNAGKSTLLGAMTRSHPKIGAYPFTTIHPNLGVLYAFGEEKILADLPGMIEGAAQGVGLGTRFLGHAERCGVLLHLIDASSETMVKDYQTIRKELEDYGAGLIDKKEIIGFSKIELISEDDLKVKIKALKKVTKNLIVPFSAITKTGLDDLKKALWK